MRLARIGVMSIYTECQRCVMDHSAGDIKFDDHGYCNYCSDFLAKKSLWSTLEVDSKARDNRLSDLLKELKSDGVGKPYDCIIGVSGGVDSSWVLAKAVSLGLRPLAVHMDNGWNSNLAVSNISNLINELGVDLYTHVIDWHEYKNLMESFFRADVIDVELLYDNALHEVCYSQAKKYGLKHILSGSNFSTEGIQMPKGWSSGSKWDGRNIKQIAKITNTKIRSFPLFTTMKWLKYTYINGIRWVPFLDLLSYKKEGALRELEEKYDYERYPYKHYESVFTRFYQGFILPTKFSVDKRRVHLSALVLTGEISREDALSDLRQIPYPSERALESDKNYFLKKMEWGPSKLESYLERPGVPHEKYGTDLTRRILLTIIGAIPMLQKYVKALP